MEQLPAHHINKQTNKQAAQEKLHFRKEQKNDRQIKN